MHKNGFSKDEMEDRKKIIYGNTVIPMAVILNAMSDLDILFENPKLEVSNSGVAVGIRHCFAEIRGGEIR